MARCRPLMEITWLEAFAAFSNTILQLATAHMDIACTALCGMWFALGRASFD